MTTSEDNPAAESISNPEARDYTRIHLRIGWWSILVFLTLGLGLEWLHATKAPWFLNQAAPTRRSLLTLAHAHGVLLGMGHVAFALSVSHLKGCERRLRGASAGLIAAGVLIPLGFTP